MIRPGLLAITFVLAVPAFGKKPAPLPDMGADWFTRLQNPDSRIKALEEIHKAGPAELREHKDSEEFASYRKGAVVFPCPQPQYPAAWAVFYSGGWPKSQAILCGLEARDYDPHPMEVERRRQWNAALENPDPNFKPWQVGQPWFKSLSGFLVDSSGKQLDSGFFGSPAVLADFNNDGMLDLLKVERHHLKTGAKSESYMDCISIGSLAAAQARQVMIFCNLRTDIHQPRTWRFAIHSDDHGMLKLVFVPLAKDQPQITFQFKEGKFVASTDPLPDGILVNPDPVADEWLASKSFLESHGLHLSGIGSDDASEIEAGRQDVPVFGSFESITWSIPDTAGLTPREAAQAMVRHQFARNLGDHYQIASVGEPVPPAQQGWVERWYDGSGWSEESVVVWWLDGHSAKLWEQRDSSTFIVAEWSAAELGRRIAIAHEIDLARTVPKDPFAPTDDHKRFGASDMPIFSVRAMTVSPAPCTTVFPQCRPSVWQCVGSRYDRDLASIVATYFCQARAEKPGVSQSIRKLAPTWLDPQAVAAIPPGLSRAAVRAIGKNHWREMKPLLQKLQTSFGPVSDSEKRLVELDRMIEAYWKRRFGPQGREEWLAKRKLHSMERERRDLIVKLTVDARYELREPVKKALAELRK